MVLSYPTTLQFRIRDKTRQVSQTFAVQLRDETGTTVEFTASADRPIFRSAYDAGYVLTTGCLQGRCAICRARLVSGEVKKLGSVSKNAVSDPANRPDGCVLLCSVGPCSDVVLEPLSPWRKRQVAPRQT